jgi:hypothetical protein
VALRILSCKSFTVLIYFSFAAATLGSSFVPLEVLLLAPPVFGKSGTPGGAAYVNLFGLFPKQNDARIADAIMELFRKNENLDIFNKKAFYIFIKEQVDADTTSITKIMKQMKNIYIELYNQYDKDGVIKKLS